MIRAQDIIEWGKSQVFTYEGDKNLVIDGFSSLSRYKKGSLTWIKKAGISQQQEITCAVIQKGIDTNIPNRFIAENSKQFFFGILEHFFASKRKLSERLGSYIGEDVQLAEDVVIGCNCTLDGKIKIGKGTIIEHNVTVINDVTIGENCIIHSGTIIGKDGFGYAFDENNTPIKVPHFGGVKIGDRVEIGANCTIDRGTIDSTIIGDDTKIDNLVLIAHNAEIGNDVIIVGCTDIAGSSSIGNKSYIGPQSCIKNQVKVGNNSFIGMGTLLSEDIGDSMFVAPRKAPIRIKNYRRFL